MVFWGEYIAYLVIQQFHCSFYINRNTCTCAPGCMYNHIQSRLVITKHKNNPSMQIHTMKFQATMIKSMDKSLAKVD